MTVMMYTVKGCKLCRVAKKIMDENNILYLEKQFSSDTLRKGGFPYFEMNGIFYNHEEFIALIARYLMFQVRKENEC